MECYRGTRARKARKWPFQCSEWPPSTDSRDFLSKIKNRFFENLKISRTPLDLGCHSVDMTILYLIVATLIWCYNDFLQHLSRHLEILSRLINKKCAFFSRIWPNIAHFMAKIIDPVPKKSNFRIALHLPSLWPKIRK